MASKREEEKNEKIIRGLMKLPPNRRCINCNNLGPQYVCTNFWTFVCMICSGIHREFTHRVKSVSMSKFTSQEVDALQNGGNQRAREIYLKDWDLQRQRLPNSSDVDKVREFIKAVYVGRKYAGGNKSEKPPSDLQGERDIADEMRRASSYHSYSQSPPYDFQYEDRLNRKQGGSLNRKPGSDRGLFDRKAASFVYSPGRFSDHIYEDRFANEGSSSRVSDYSVSSGGDPFRSAPQSPNLQKEDSFSSPTSNSSREIADGLQRQISNTNFDAVSKKDADKIPVPRPQRTVSSVTIAENKVSTFSLPSRLPAENSGVLPLGIPAPSSAPAIDLFQPSTTIDLFQSPEVSSVLPQNFRAPQTSSLSFFPEISQNSYAPNFSEKLPELSEPINEGWATFESHQPTGTSILKTPDSGSQSEVGISAKHPDSVSSSNTGLQWPNVQNTNLHEPASLASHLWNEDLQNPQVSTMASGQPWKAFEQVDEKEHKRVEVQGMDLQYSADRTSFTTDLYLGLKPSEDSSVDGLQKLGSNEGFSFPTLPPHVPSGFPLFNQSIRPFMTNVADADVGQKSSNPFDSPFDSEFEGNNAFLGMSNLQAALPNMPLSSPYAGGLDEPWYPPSPIGSQGGMLYNGTQAPTTQLTNVPAHGPVASIGGNPFA